MHITYAYDENLPSTGTDTEQVMNTIAALGRRGVEVDLVVPRRPGTAPLTADVLRSYYHVDGPFRVHQIQGSARSRTWQKVAHAARAVRHPAARGADLVYTRNLTSLQAALALKLPAVYETYRPWPAQHRVMRPLFRRWLAAPTFLGGVFHSGHARDCYTSLAPPGVSLEVMHNGYAPARMTPRLERGEARARVGLPTDRAVATYAGHIGPTKGLDIVIAMARRCPEVTFQLVGSEGEGAVERAARAVANVRLVPWKSFDAIAPYLYASDVLLLPPSLAPLARHGSTVLPMKLFLYLAAGRVVLAPRAPDTAELLRDGENAALVAPDDAAAAAAALRRVIEDRGYAETLARGALETASGLTWDARAARLEGFLGRVLEARARR